MRNRTDIGIITCVTSTSFRSVFYPNIRSASFPHIPSVDPLPNPYLHCIQHDGLKCLNSSEWQRFQICLVFINPVLNYIENTSSSSTGLSLANNSKRVAYIKADMQIRCSLSVKSTIFAECLAVIMVMNIGYSACCRIDISALKIEFFLFPLIKDQGQKELQF